MLAVVEGVLSYDDLAARSKEPARNSWPRFKSDDYRKAYTVVPRGGRGRGGGDGAEQRAAARRHHVGTRHAGDEVHLQGRAGQGRNERLARAAQHQGDAL